MSTTTENPSAASVETSLTPSLRGERTAAHPCGIFTASSILTKAGSSVLVGALALSLSPALALAASSDPTSSHSTASSGLTQLAPQSSQSEGDGAFLTADELDQLIGLFAGVESDSADQSEALTATSQVKSLVQAESSDAAAHAEKPDGFAGFLYKAWNWLMNFLS